MHYKSNSVSDYHLLAAGGGCCELAGVWTVPALGWFSSSWFWFLEFLMNDVWGCSRLPRLPLEARGASSRGCRDWFAACLMVLQTPAEMKQKRSGRRIVKPIHPGFDKKKERTWVAAGRCSLAPEIRVGN